MVYQIILFSNGLLLTLLAGKTLQFGLSKDKLPFYVWLLIAWLAMMGNKIFLFTCGFGNG